MNAILYITSLSDWFSSFLNGNECVRMCVCDGEQYVNSFQLNNNINFWKISKDLYWLAFSMPVKIAAI